MNYKILADLVVVAHLLWIVFLLFGALIGVRYRPVKYLHIAGLGYAIVMQVFGWFCPLTHLEVFLRAKHDPSLGYSGSFISYYLEKIIYVEISGTIIFVLTVVLCAFNAFVYLSREFKRPGTGS
jgi:hypothetical protein